MKTNLEEKIFDAKLTKTEKLIASYILENETEVSFMTAADIATKVGTSDASVIRMARAIGYTGFNELQKDIQQSVSYKARYGSNSIMSPSQKLISNMDMLNSSDLANNLLNLAVKNLQTTFSYNAIEKIDSVSDLLIKSRRKYFVGFRVASSIAECLGISMRHLLPDVKLITSGDFSAIEAFNDLTSEDCVVFVSFPRYPKIMDTLFDMAKNVGAKTIFMTEGITSPHAKEADILIPASVDSLSFFNSYIAPLFLAELISADVSRKKGLDCEIRMKNLDIYVNEAGMY
ncbi:MAG: MurR/RpiR family transcriptional regulator [Oscillospiraceae bacterium]